MKYLWRPIFLLLLCLFCQMPVLYSLEYTVRPGDSLWALSRQYGIPSEALQKLNELISEQLREGQRLYIPPALVPYTVQPGDHLTGLARKFKTSVRYIIVLNNLAEDSLFIGQQLQIPSNLSTETVQRKEIFHTVQPGDSLSLLAQRYNCSVEDIKSWNTRTNDQVLSGEKLRILLPANSPDPVHTVPTKTASQKITYTVQSGDTLSAIAQRYALSQTDILEWNKRSNPSLLAGEQLVLFVSASDTNPPAKAKALLHQVRSGEHLSGLAHRYGVSVSDIKKWNDLKRDHLYLDEELKIYARAVPEQTAKSTSLRKWTYTVQSGDNLSSLAGRYQVSVDDIRKWNSKKNDTLYRGEKLVLYTSKAPQPVKQQQVAPVKTLADTTSWRNITIYPVAKTRISSLSRTEKGLILHLKSRSPVKAISKGVVEYAGFIKTKNYVVILNLGGDKRVVYGYLSETQVTAGDQVLPGQTLGYVDYLAIHETRPLLLELYENTSPVDIYALYPYLRELRFTAFK